MYKKIPIWQSKQKIITTPQQPSFSLTLTSNLQPPPPSQLIPIFINNQYQILISSSLYFYNKNQIITNINNQQLQSQLQLQPQIQIQIKNNKEINNINNIEQDKNQQYQQYTLIYDKINNRVMGIGIAVYACGYYENIYWICYVDYCGRLRIVKCDNLWQAIFKLNKNISKQNNYQIQNNNKQNKQINNNNYGNKQKDKDLNEEWKDTQILPLPKYNQYIYQYKNQIFLTGNKSICQWQLTSKIWSFNLNSYLWTQVIQSKENIKQQRQSNQKINNVGRNKVSRSIEKDKSRENQRYSSKNKQRNKQADKNQQKDKQKNKLKQSIRIKQKHKNQQQNLQKSNSSSDKNQWILMLENVIIYIANNYIHFQLIRNNKMHPQLKKIQLCDIKQSLFNTQTDNFITCSYTLKNTPHLLILTKPTNPDRQPILLCLSLSMFIQSHSTSQHTTNIHLHSFSHTQSIKSQQSKSIIKSVNTNNILNYSRTVKIDENLYMNVARYDLGVFLSHGVQSGNNLWKIVNQVVFMQVSNTGSQGGNNFMQSMSLTGNFIKKNEQSHAKSTNNKNLMLCLYTKAKKNLQSTQYCSQVQTYSIKLSNLSNMNISQSSKPLSYYFQKKQYNDLLFLAQKRQVPCNRQLFQFYSSKFKKLYSNSSSTSTVSNSSQNNQQQTLVKLDHTKLTTIYFLVQHMFHNFSISLKGFDEQMLIDLMILSHKFQVSQMQILCEQQVKFNITNFPKLYDYFRNSQTPLFRQQFLKFFIIHAQQIIKIMPIGKVQQLIRLVYSPECPHINLTQLKSKLQNCYFIKDCQNQIKQINKSINYCNIIKNQQIIVKICLKCHRLVNFNYENHRKNKSSIRDSSVGVKNKKKDNNSN